MSNEATAPSEDTPSTASRSTPWTAPQTLADYGDKVFLVVNVASRCGLTQHETLEQLQQRYGDRGFQVLGFPEQSVAAGAVDQRGDRHLLGDLRHHVPGARQGEGQRQEGRAHLRAKKTPMPRQASVVNREVPGAAGRRGQASPRTVPDALEIVEAIEAALPA